MSQDLIKRFSDPESVESKRLVELTKSILNELTELAFVAPLFVIETVYKFDEAQLSGLDTKVSPGAHKSSSATLEGAAEQYALLLMIAHDPRAVVLEPPQIVDSNDKKYIRGLDN